MIKPVYFGNGREDKFLLDCANRMDNFSDWVKTKLIEEFNVKIVGISMRDTVKDSVNHGTQRVEIQKDRVEEKVNIDIENAKKNKIDLNQWTL